VGIFEKPEILRLCIKCHVSVEIAVCRIMKLWMWFSMNSADGTAEMTPELLVMACGADEQFWREVANVGWLVFDEDRQTVNMPGWDERFSKAAKARAKHAKDQAKYRAKQQSDQSVIQGDHEAITRGEERKGEENSSSSPDEVKKEIIPEFLRAWNESTKTKNFSGKPFMELVQCCSNPSWITEAKKAIKRLPKCAYFQTPVTIYQVTKDGFVDKINAGSFDTVTKRKTNRYGEADQAPPKEFDDETRQRVQWTLQKLQEKGRESV
jgi:hypothetical protein